MSKASNSSLINLTGRSQTQFETAYIVLNFRKESRGLSLTW